jgi:acetylornithine/succinyldiaminopimelate/putrescine aminotransferase
MLLFCFVNYYLGNGYPVAAVICRRNIAESFASTGIEYFNTYGGNSVACSIAEAVIDTIISEDLQVKNFIVNFVFFLIYMFSSREMH